MGVAVPHHGYWHSRSSCEPWNSSDNELIYQKTCQDIEKRKLLENYGWYPYSPIEYRFNSHGFRTDEFNSTMGILALGCSHTSGIGLHRCQAWPEQLAALLEKRVWNLGVGGASLDTCYRLLEYWAEKLSIEAVVISTPRQDRMELFDPDGEPISYLPACPHFAGFEYYKYWISHDANSKISHKKNTMAIKYLCEQRKIPVLFYSDIPDTPIEMQEDLARDLQHAGPKTHQTLAKRISRDLQEIL